MGEKLHLQIFFVWRIRGHSLSLMSQFITSKHLISKFHVVFSLFHVQFLCFLSYYTFYILYH